GNGVCKGIFHQDEIGVVYSPKEDPMQMGDRCIRVTIHHCFFDSMRPIYAVQQGPPLQQNYTRDWGIYAVCDIVKAQVVSSVTYMMNR
uniref:Uncharacterized protein n=1 Tax=Aegilops tauschii subsp. strangulata TaxID=200361 RepID=A0A453GC24_AEGTS